MRPGSGGIDGGGGPGEPRAESGGQPPAAGGPGGARPDGRRKPYRAPRLIVYGDLRAITRFKGSGAVDGGSLNSKLF
jgi:hypothetical protein